MINRLKKKFDGFIYNGLIAFPILLLLAVTIFPFLFMIAISFFNVRSYNFGGAWQFVGLENYIKVFGDSENISAIMNSLLFMVYALSIEVCLGFIIASLLLVVPKRERMFFLLPLVIPILLAPIIVGMIWKQMLAFDSGIINNVLLAFRADPIVWLSPNFVFNVENSWGHALQSNLNLRWGFVSLILIEVWQWTPLFVCGFLTAFSFVKEEVVKSANIDGANQFQILFNIYLPLSKPLILGIVLLRIMDMLKVYETIWVLFGNSLIYKNINIQLVELGLTVRNYSYCASFSVVLFLMVFILLLCGSKLVDISGKLYYE